MRSNIEEHVRAVKARIAPNQWFGVGLRLSAGAAEELASGEELPRFKAYLRSHNLYVYTINGFPYGIFHGQRVKEQVYRPDWLEEPRLRYTDRLTELLAELLPPEFSDLAGTISTVPLGFQPRVTREADMARCAKFLVAHVARLLAIRGRTGKTIALALEPEPCCALEGVQDTVAFFEQWLFSRSAVTQLQRLTGLARRESEEALHRHLGVCLDACHLALQFLEPQEAISAFAAAGLRILKVQISTGLRAVRAGEDRETLDGLRQFADPVYLHQAVIKAADGTYARYADLTDAVSALARRHIDWQECRIHFHVPIFLDRLGLFFNTQPFLRGLLDAVSAGIVTQHLEVETYTWEVLPDAYRTEQVVESIARELAWVLRYLQSAVSDSGAGHDIGRASTPTVSPMSVGMSPDTWLS